MVFLAIGLVCGVFYREFSKGCGIAGIFHATLGVGIVLVFIALLLKDKSEKA